jgi:pimeloyl-[acyl-carrier protein] methyl ester esterase
MKLHTEIYGTGEPVVFIHGWAMHSGIWRTFAKQLARDYQVFCVDLPGHGHSEKLPVFSLEAISHQLHNILPQAGCTLVGWSLGGMVALDLASRFPHKIKQLVMIGSNPCFVQSEQWAGIRNTTLETFADNLISDCQGTLLRFLSLQVKGLEDYKAVFKKLKTTLQACDCPQAEVLQGGLKVLQQDDLRPQLARLVCRVQVILGSHDTLVPVAVAKQLQVLNPRLHLHVIDKAAHVPFLSHSAHTLAILREFLETMDAG